MINTGPVGYGQKLNAAGVAAIPPPVAVRPELTDEDIEWLNDQLRHIEHPKLTYARRLPRPPVAVRYSA